MKAKHDINSLTYQGFSTVVKAIGYKLETKKEKKRTKKRIIAKEPKPQEFAKDTWIYNKNGFAAKIQTSVAKRGNKIRIPTKGSKGWAMVCKGDRAIFQMQPFVRRGSFLLRLTKAAEIVAAIVDHMPLCEVCDANITFREREDDSRFYEGVCSRHPNTHPKIKDPYSIAKPYLKKETLVWLEERLKDAQYYKKYANKKGIEYGAAKERKIPYELKTENLEL